MPNLLLSSKMQIPHTTDVIERTGLIDTFYKQQAKKITIVRAPAGYGKTTTLSQWLRHAPGKSAWVTLDSNDSEPTRYWMYLLRAIANASPILSFETLSSLLYAQDRATLEFFVHSLIEELHTIDEPLHLVLDDYHLIDNSVIHELMTPFIEQLPEQVHVYVATRTELPWPVSKWRVKQWVYEVNVERLRFTLPEADELFTVKGLTLPSRNLVQQLVDQTEGWVAGLILAGLTLGSDPSPQQWEDSANAHVFEFLLQEILASLPLDTQNFLLHTSLLNEMEPMICNQLTNRTDSLTVLEELEKKGLFTVRLQALQPVFRYHQLLGDALHYEWKRRFSTQQIQHSVQEAAHLIYQKGDFTAAIELALQYELQELAVTWITEQLVGIYQSGQTATYMNWLRQLQTKRYPVPYEMLVIGLITSISLTDIQLTISLMQELESRQHIERWMEQQEHAPIAHLYEITKAYATVAAGGDMKFVEAFMKQQVQQEPILSRWHNVPMPYNLFEYKLLRTGLGSKGKMPLIEDVAPIAQLLRETTLKTWNVTAFSYGLSAETFYERNLLELAQQDLEAAIRLGHQHQDPGLFVPMYLLKAKIYTRQKQSASAQVMLTQLVEQVSQKHWKTPIRIMQAYCYLIDGDAVSAEHILQQTKTKQPFWLLVDARLSMLKRQHQDALTALIEVKIMAQQAEQIATIVEATMLEALVHHQSGNTATALTTLHEALTLAAPYTYVRTFLDEPRMPELLKTYTQTRVEGRANSVPATYLKLLREDKLTRPKGNVLLTPRENDVYDLLAEGQSNRQIAEHLNLSEGTIRVYLSNIYQKLEVSTRSQAILLRK